MGHRDKPTMEPHKESSSELSTLASQVLKAEPWESRQDVDEYGIEGYNELLRWAKRLAGSVLSQDETPEVDDERPYPKFNAGDKVYIEKADVTKTVVRAYDYSGEWAYVLEDAEGLQDEGWREDELRLEETE